MRRALTTLAIASCLFTSGIALGKDDPPPPPPPPPPSDSSSSGSADKKDGDAPSSGGGLRSTDGLLDASQGKKRPMMLSFFLGFAYPYYVPYVALPLAARFNLPIIHDGFVPQINDSFDIEFGLDIGIAPGACCGRAPIYILPIIEPRYTVYLLPNLAVYAKPLNLGIAIWPSSGGAQVVFFHYHFAVGVVFEITKTLYLRGELGTNSIRGGIGIAF